MHFIVENRTCKFQDLRSVSLRKTSRKEPRYCPKSQFAYDMWKVSKGIPKSSKLFIVQGTYPAIKQALLDRGWIENPDNESLCFDLKWTTKARIPQEKKDWQSFNHFENNAELCTKSALTNHLAKLRSANTAEFYPRAFVSGSDINENFYEYFKANLAVSLLKKYAAGAELSWEKASVCISIAKRLIKYNPASEKPLLLVSSEEWKLLKSDSQSEKLKCIWKLGLLNRPTDCKQLALKVLNKLSQKDPQFLMSGVSNLWIVKPGRKSRGRDIAILGKLNEIIEHIRHDQHWVIQKYIENPLVIHNKKFDIRQWVLVTSAEPLTIYIYKDSYLRFSVEDFQLKNSSVFVHLTNNSISKQSVKFEARESMWHIDKFKQYLITTYGSDLWETKIFKRIRKIVKWSLISVGRLGHRKSNNFELFGYDFLVDEHMKPWLLEVNSSPAMDYSTPVTETLVKQVLTDVMKTVVDRNPANFLLCYKAKPRI